MPAAWTEKLPQGLRDYHKISRSSFFGLLMVLLLLLIYESSSAVIYREQAVIIQNRAEAMIKRTLWFMGLYQFWMPWLAFALLLGLAYWQARKQNLLHIKPPYFPLAILESLAYAVLFSGLMNFVTTKSITIKFLWSLLGDRAVTLPAKMALALGAGIYEELLFRLGMFTFVLWFARKVMPAKPYVHQVLALVVSAALFSGFHFLGREPFAMLAFVHRFYAGILLGLIFSWRGIGVVVYTHAFYDLFLILRTHGG
ncbi:MAG: CPBP family intramembrane metalloprotease [candidate division KSB1 bacterium]|nr:CPBP family intramembrane metalloprotease [candidate division KSB1 bacterium]MDZ7275943.1 CPBP family intramembrane metalloprotease [candidate division KSB1 bacterium]MDZ7285775.1 CPBP family intramembrane metalloprotease [candidate division KSB1 bacterium]MDZ7298807.1 CPBP family intramembrane metalloprotease [candidate division KSB1 bacterium]MDZ7308847.1 CPBP family intramembrane metalloprotease [candidate division KSB1 bacterium]